MIEVKTDANVICGGKGKDVLTGTSRPDTIYGYEGRDQLIGLAGRDTLFGGFGNDVLKGGGGSDRLVGGAGDDILIGGKANDDYVFSNNDGYYNEVHGFVEGDAIVIQYNATAPFYRVAISPLGAVVYYGDTRLVVKGVSYDELMAMPNWIRVEY